MSVPQNVADVIRDHVTLELECIDRMYLNVYQPGLQVESHVAGFLRQQREAVSSRCFERMTHEFVCSIEAFAERHSVPLISFDKKQRKDDVAAEHRDRFTEDEGIYLIGKAQEKVPSYRTQGRRNSQTGQTYPWIVRSSAYVNQYYFYGVDADFGPFFLKFSSYFPHGAKLCINGHEYVKRQLTKEGIAFEDLDNGIGACANPRRMQQIANGLDARKIDALLRKWLGRVPHPFTPADRKAGFVYDVSILQMELSLTQVLEQALAGRIFFEEVIRDNLDLGRPDKVQLIFNRRVTKKTPGRFRTRVVTAGVVPALYVDYKSSRIKQYFKLIRQLAGLRTETTINNTYDFGIGRRLVNLPALRDLGFQANRRLLDVQKASQDSLIGEAAFRTITSPKQVGNQRASAMPYGNETVLALMHLLLLFRILPCGFRNKELRQHLAPLLGKDPATCSQGQLTYQLRRLRVHGLIERLQGTHRYQVTEFGLRVALSFARSYARVVRPCLGQSVAAPLPQHTRLQQALAQVDRAIEHLAKVGP